jgi:hypothetical protein
MTSQIFRFEFQPWREIRLLEELSDRGIDTEKLTLLVLMETLRATGLSLVQDPLRSSPLLCIPPPDPRRGFTMFSDDDEDEDDN